MMRMDPKHSLSHAGCQRAELALIPASTNSSETGFCERVDLNPFF